MVHTLFLVAVALLGSCVGSFLNVVIYRIPAGTFFSGGSRSHCPKCKAPIAWFDNLPVVSWLILLRGKARCCNAPISVRYPLVELLTAALLTLLFYGDVVGSLPIEVGPGVVWPAWHVWAVFGFRALFLAMLIACSFIDIDHRILPDVLTKPTMFVGLVGAFAAPGLVDSFTVPPASPAPFDHLLYSFAGMLAGLALTAGIRSAASSAFGQEAMGFGDVKFMGAIGAFVGWNGALFTFFLGSLLGAFYGGVHRMVTGETKIFFGPFLAAGAAITLFFKQEIITFFTLTLPVWQASLSPWILITIALVMLVLLVFIVRSGRRR